MNDRVTVESDGRTYTASYVVAKKIITVSTINGHKSTQLGGLPAEHLAKVLLQELIREGKA